MIFGRKISRRYGGKLQTEIEDMDLSNPVIRSHYRHGFVKQYVRDHLMLRTETATNNVYDYGVNKAVDNLPTLQEKLAAIHDRYLDVQQDILESFLDHGRLRKLSEPARLPNGRRIPGLKLDHPRQLALMQALLRFSHIAAGGTFRTTEIHAHTAKALGSSITDYKLGSLRYDLFKLRAKGLVEKLPHSRRYRLNPQGYQICLIYLKLFHKIYAPLTHAVLEPFPADQRLPTLGTNTLDQHYRAVEEAMDHLLAAVGLRAA